MKKTEDEFIRETNEQFNHSVENLDGEVASRITQMRYRALEQTDKSGFFQSLSGWIPVSAMASACLAVIVFMSLPEQQQQTAPLATDLDLISSSDELELFEDLEFYQWLEDHELPS